MERRKHGARTLYLPLDTVNNLGLLDKNQGKHSEAEKICRLTGLTGDDAPRPRL